MGNSADSAMVVDQQTAAFIQRYVSINLATTDISNRPAVTRAFGCRLAPDNRSLIVFISSEHNRAVLDNIVATRAIAVAFSRPGTHKTIQLKGRDALLVTIEPSDYPLLAACRESMIEELQGIGCSCATCSIEPVETSPQTPGPASVMMSLSICDPCVNLYR